MKRICPNCLSINDTKESSIQGSLLIGFTLIGAGIGAAALTLQDNNYIYLFIGLISILLGSYSIRNYYRKFNKICPKCKFDNMPTLNEPEGQKIIQEKGMGIKDDSTHHCNDCGFGVDGIVQSKMGSILVIIIGMILLPFSFTNPILIILTFIGCILMIAAGIYGLWTNYRKSFTCPNCKNKTLVAIESK